MEISLKLRKDIIQNIIPKLKFKANRMPYEQTIIEISLNDFRVLKEFYNMNGSFFI